MPDLYAVLGVGRTADAGEIRAAYRRHARRHHPDLGGDEQRMMVLNKAWHVLGNADRRAAYDARRSGRKATPAKSRDGYTVLDFGRYEGWSLREIAGEDDNYFEWLRRTPAGRVLTGRSARSSTTVRTPTKSSGRPRSLRNVGVPGDVASRARALRSPPDLTGPPVGIPPPGERCLPHRGSRSQER
jgi:curved DNA-binding protein CbpA